jgi:hypothetical protein
MVTSIFLPSIPEKNWSIDELMSATFCLSKGLPSCVRPEDNLTSKSIRSLDQTSLGLLQFWKSCVFLSLKHYFDPQWPWKHPLPTLDLH